MYTHNSQSRKEAENRVASTTGQQSKMYQNPH